MKKIRVIQRLNRLNKWLTFSQILRSLGKSILIEGKKAKSKGERKTERLYTAFVFKQRVYTQRKTGSRTNELRECLLKNLIMESCFGLQVFLFYCNNARLILGKLQFLPSFLQTS